MDANAALSFFDANLASENVNPDLTLLIRTDNSIVLPATNPAFVTLKFDLKKGAFSGSFQITDQVAGKPVVRNAPFSGLLIPGSGAFGYFTLPQLFASTRQPALSGGVELAPAP
jgi:hypothetical protein